MGNRYFYPNKDLFKKEDIKGISLVFSNGEDLLIRQVKVKELDLQLYDELYSYDAEFIPVVRSGKIISKILEDNYYSFECEELENNIDKKLNISNKLEKSYDIIRIRLHKTSFNEITLSGVFKCNINKNSIIIEAIPSPLNKSFNEKEMSVELRDINKDNIALLHLFFPDLEELQIYNEDIVEMNLTFDNELVRESDNFLRAVKHGYIKYQIPDKRSLFFREFAFSDGTRRLTSKKIKNKLCSINKNSHQIKHLYIQYKNYETFNRETERLKVKNVGNIYGIHIGGICEINEDIITIYFGNKE